MGSSLLCRQRNDAVDDYDIGGPIVSFSPNNSFRAAANINGGTVSFGASNTAFQSTFTNKYSNPVAFQYPRDVHRDGFWKRNQEFSA